MKTLYDVLNVRADDDAKSVREAFRKAVKANHPDLNAGDPDAQSRFAQVLRANAILRDPELRAIYDRMLEFEGKQYRPQSELVAIFNTAYRVAADAIMAFVFAFALAGGAYKLFTYVSATSDVTAHTSLTAAAVPPVAPVEAAGHPNVEAAEHPNFQATKHPKVETTEHPNVEATEHPKLETPEHPNVEATEYPKVEAAGHAKAAGLSKPYAAALGAPVDVATDVKTAVDAALGHPKATAAPPPQRPTIAGEPRDKPEGADTVAPNGQAPAANSDESLSLAGLTGDTRPSAAVPVNNTSRQVPSSELPGLALDAPKNVAGVMNTAIDRLSPDKRLPDTRAAQLDPGTPAIQPLDSEQAAKLLQRGRELLRTGDIAGARLALKPAADAGNAEAALALGQTFDPRYLARQKVIGIVGDEARARTWYQRAMELGSTEAKDILSQMATK